MKRKAHLIIAGLALLIGYVVSVASPTAGIVSGAAVFVIPETLGGILFGFWSKKPEEKVVLGLGDLAAAAAAKRITKDNYVVAKVKEENKQTTTAVVQIPPIKTSTGKNLIHLTTREMGVAKGSVLEEQFLEVTTSQFEIIMLNNLGVSSDSGLVTRVEVYETFEEIGKNNPVYRGILAVRMAKYVVEGDDNWGPVYEDPSDPFSRRYPQA